MHVVEATVAEPRAFARGGMMGNRIVGLALAFAVAGLPGSASGDDLTGQDRLLCTAVEVTRCMESGTCTSELPWNLNIPQFMEVDLKAKTFATTKASGENRSSPIRTLVREEGLLVLQGFEAGRAFSFVIHEESGMASVAVARDGLTVSIFGACTPLAQAPK
jgi:hypothetical protein